MPLKLYNPPSPLETQVLSKRFGLDQSETLEVYLANDGFKAFLKAREMGPEKIIEEVKTSALRGRGGSNSVSSPLSQFLRAGACTPAGWGHCKMAADPARP